MRQTTTRRILRNGVRKRGNETKHLSLEVWQLVCVISTTPPAACTSCVGCVGSGVRGRWREVRRAPPPHTPHAHWLLRTVSSQQVLAAGTGLAVCPPHAAVCGWDVVVGVRPPLPGPCTAAQAGSKGRESRCPLRKRATSSRVWRLVPICLGGGRAAAAYHLQAAQPVSGRLLCGATSTHTHPGATASAQPGRPEQAFAHK